MLVDIDEAKTHLCRLVDQAAAGEENIIGKAGRPMARLAPYVAPHERRTPGALKGKLWVDDDVDRTPDWLADALEGHA